MWKSLKRWPVLLALLVAFGGLAVGLVFLPGGRVTRENCERIRVGMTEAEVRAILGKPWDDSLLDPEISFRGLEKGNLQWWLTVQLVPSFERTQPPKPLQKICCQNAIEMSSLWAQ